MQSNYDVVIIGAGILGLSAAYHIKENTHLKICVLEKESDVAFHASGKSAGMIRHLYKNELLTELTKESIATWPKELKDKFFVKTSSLILGRTKPDHNQFLFEEKKLGKDLGVITKEDGLLNCKGFIFGLKEILKDKGVDFRFNFTVRRLEKNTSGFLIESASDKIQAGLVINSAGAWVNTFIPEEEKIDATAYARHLFEIKNFKQEIFPINDLGFFWDETKDCYFRKWNKNSKIASVCDLVAADPDNFTPNNKPMLDLQSKIREAYKIEEEIKILDSWHCFRTYSKDQTPIIKQINGLYFLACFGGYGMSTGFAGAKSLVSAII